MKLIVKMDSHDDNDWFMETEKMLLSTFKKHNVIPRKGDVIPCDVGDIHTVESVQWGDGFILIWLEHLKHYKAYRERLRAMELIE